MSAAVKRLPNIHPGKVLLEEFLKPLARRVGDIVLGRQRLNADTATRLARRLGTSEHFWMSLQAEYDLEEARRSLGTAARRGYNML